MDRTRIIDSRIGALAKTAISRQSNDEASLEAGAFLFTQSSLVGCISMRSSGKQCFWKARRSSNDPRSHCSYSWGCSRTGIRSWSGRIASLQSAIAPEIDRATFGAFPPEPSPGEDRLPLQGDPCPGLRALGPCGLGKAGQRDEAAPQGLARQSDSYGLRQVGDVVDRPGFRLRLHAFQAQGEAPHHGLQDAPAEAIG
jgi:hypothetical protein